MGLHHRATNLYFCPCMVLSGGTQRQLAHACSSEYLKVLWPHPLLFTKHGFRALRPQVLVWHPASTTWETAARAQNVWASMASPACQMCCACMWSTDTCLLCSTSGRTGTSSSIIAVFAGVIFVQIRSVWWISFAFPSRETSALRLLIPFPWLRSFSSQFFYQEISTCLKTLIDTPEG